MKFNFDRIVKAIAFLADKAWKEGLRKAMGKDWRWCEDIGSDKKILPCEGEEVNFSEFDWLSLRNDGRRS